MVQYISSTSPSRRDRAIVVFRFMIYTSFESNESDFSGSLVDKRRGEEGDRLDVFGLVWFGFKGVCVFGTRVFFDCGLEWSD